MFLKNETLFSTTPEVSVVVQISHEIFVIHYLEELGVGWWFNLQPRLAFHCWDVVVTSALSPACRIIPSMLVHYVVNTLGPVFLIEQYMYSLQVHQHHFQK